MSIAIVCFSQSWGGLEIMLARIAAALSKRGHSVHVVSPAGSPLEEQTLADSIRHIALTPRFKYADIRTARELARLYIGNGIQVVLAGHSRDISTLVFARWFSRSTRLAYFQQMQFGHSKRDLLHRITYRELDAWITLTNRMKSEVQKNTIVPEARISVIPFGVDPAVLNPKLFSQPRSRKILRLPAKKLLVGLIGRIDRQKGQEDLLRSAPLVLKAVPNARFVFVGEETRGEPGFLEELKRLGQDLGVSDKIYFLPFTKDIPLILSALDIITVPSHSETFGYVALEAMAMGLPVVGTNAGGIPEIVEDGATGFLIAPRDPQALGEKILLLLKDKKKRISMGRRGRRAILERFDFEARVQDLENILASLR